MSAFLITDVYLGSGSCPVSVVVSDSRVAAIIDVPDNTLPRLDGRGRRLLPGFRDDHLHLGACLRASRSLQFGTPHSDWHACENGWIVVFGIDNHHDMDAARRLIDEHVNIPTMIVHRTGHAALVNGAGAAALGRISEAQLLYDRGIWAQALGPASPEREANLLASLRRDLLEQGITSVQDATPYPAAAEARCAFLADALDPIHVDFMGDPASPVAGANYRKVLRPVEPTPGVGKPLAVHAIAAEEIVAATRHTNVARIEHAALCPPAVADLIAERGVRVCANPGFLATRAEALAGLHETSEAAFFQPIGPLLHRGVDVSFGSDAPVSPPGVWDAIGVARETVGVWAAVSAASSEPALIGSDRQQWLGRKADLVLVDREITRAEATIVGGRIMYAPKSRAFKVTVHA